MQARRKILLQWRNKNLSIIQFGYQGGVEPYARLYPGVIIDSEGFAGDRSRVQIDP